MLDLQGKLLRIATNYLVDSQFAHKYEFRQRFLSDMKVLQILSVKINFTFSLIHCDFDWGNLQPNKTWTGMIGKLVTQVI